MLGIDVADPLTVGGAFATLLGFVLWIAKGAIEKTYSEAAESRATFTTTFTTQQKLFLEVLNRIETRAAEANKQIVAELRALAD